MHIIVQHKIHDPEVFWSVAQEVIPNLPEGLTLHHSLPSAEGTEAVCLWEADTIEDVRRFLEEAVGHVSKNEYFAVETSQALGLPQDGRAITKALPKAVIEQVVRDYFAAIRNGDPEAWIALFDEEGINYEPGNPPLRDHAARRQFFEGLGRAFERLDISADEVFVTGNDAGVKWTARGRGRNGREVTFGGIDVFEVNPEGRIQRLMAYWDPAPVMAEVQA